MYCLERCSCYPLCIFLHHVDYFYILHFNPSYHFLHPLPMQSLKIVTTTLDMKQGQLGAGLHHLGGALESGLSEVFITICIKNLYLYTYMGGAQRGLHVTISPQDHDYLEC